MHFVHLNKKQAFLHAFKFSILYIKKSKRKEYKKMSKENIQTKLICLKDSGLSLDECQFTGRLEFHDTHSIASLVSNTTCAEIMATEIFLNFDK